MSGNEILKIDTVLPELKAADQRQAFQIVTAYAARTAGIDQKKLLGRLMAWERTSISSGIGGGVAILHMTLKKLDAPFMLLARAAQKIDYDSVDGEPVDLIVLLLSPESDGPHHLQRLARISRLLRDKDLCSRLRGANTADALRALLLDVPELRRAA